ncbi:septal ring lytic transglycosylase RlpA family protein [Mesorhizobium retamae]|uniref:Endolytic peptidoglycan transglycosylase RlpA n=1 Tax=Mesorhizobium retamae TaxID=2912854 RepID=A0ABS9Q8F4_9HYPH|nr:septal ring lytic transglycosylase RlpA family protein [Mesorhizobium sp. IRAMC:0171]MCG7503693.1 septal ring lytic transglycosylase RlpA family protein [Mesorhizobium sp. IRAMC:0171]
MPSSARLRRISTYVLLAASAGLLAACASPQPKSMVSKKRSKEYFAESAYGVKASPRVAMRRGGGRDQVGKPYQVRGKWYYPKEEKRYSKTGTASWYGEAFHSRLTANGEVYDLSQLTGAHPTMPLPSYARVTNLDNGSSVIVRVNDRGPYHEGRLIDLSKRAADMLGYSKIGTARVKVDYVGRAPLEGNDDSYLLASYHPGNKMPDPSDGLPTGVMVAMNGSMPTAPLSASAAAVPFPGQLTDVSSSPEPTPATQPVGVDGVALPDVGPIAPSRPDIAVNPKLPFEMASLNYAAERSERSAAAFAALEGPAAALGNWKLPEDPSDDYVAAGTFDDAKQAKQVAAALKAYGRVEIDQAKLDGKDWYSVNLYQDGRMSLDNMLEAAWSHGAPDAFAVRD